MSDERFGISMNIERIACSQITNFTFNSMCVVNGIPIAANEDGLFILDSSETDNGDDINAMAELAAMDFGVDLAKRFRKGYIGYETSGGLKVSARTDEGNYEVYTLSPSDTTQKQHRDMFSMHRNLKGVYWQFKIANIDGCDFSIDFIDALPILLTRGHR